MTSENFFTMSRRSSIETVEEIKNDIVTKTNITSPFSIKNNSQHYCCRCCNDCCRQLVATASNWKAFGDNSKKDSSKIAQEVVLNLSKTTDVMSCMRLQNTKYPTKIMEIEKFIVEKSKKCNSHFNDVIIDDTKIKNGCDFFPSNHDNNFITQPTTTTREEISEEMKLSKFSLCSSTTKITNMSDKSTANLIGKLKYVNSVEKNALNVEISTNTKADVVIGECNDCINDDIDNSKITNNDDSLLLRETSQTSSITSTTTTPRFYRGNLIRSHCHDKFDDNHLLNGSSHSTFVTETSREINNDISKNYLKNADQLLTSRSLVKQRKLDLEKKFQNQKLTFGKKFKNYSNSEQFFPSVDKLVQLYTNKFEEKNDKMVVKANKTTLTATTTTTAKATGTTAITTPTNGKRDIHRNSPLSDEGCTFGQSPYSSDCDDNDSIRTASTTIELKRKEKVARCTSSDSALGLDVDEQYETIIPSYKQGRRMTLTVTDIPDQYCTSALLPIAEPTQLPDSPINDLQLSLTSLLAQTAIPSKVLLEERVIEIPEERYNSSLSNSRRESSQSCISDFVVSECNGVRYVRTPSVVVSDYSDDIMCGITLEEIEYFRAQRMHRRRSSAETTGTERDDLSSEISGSSSCSNLYYCGSTISALDGNECYINGIRRQINRKTSDCSTCSITDNDDEIINDFSIPEQPSEDIGQLHKDLADKLSVQHITLKQQQQSNKKVGIVSDDDDEVDVDVDEIEKTFYINKDRNSNKNYMEES